MNDDREDDARRTCPTARARAQPPASSASSARQAPRRDVGDRVPLPVKRNGTRGRDRPGGGNPRASSGVFNARSCPPRRMVRIIEVRSMVRIVGRRAPRADDGASFPGSRQRAPMLPRREAFLHCMHQPTSYATVSYLGHRQGVAARRRRRPAARPGDLGGA